MRRVEHVAGVGEGARGEGRLPLELIYRASWPFVWIIVLGIVVFAVFPDLITFLPQAMSSR